MLVNKLKNALIAAAAAGAMFMGPGVTTASAIPATLTWDPSSASPALSNSGPFTFNNITIQDYSSIVLSAPDASGNIASTDSGFIPLVAFNNGPVVNVPGLDGAGGATAFGLYLQFSGTDIATVNASGDVIGHFTSLNYSLYGDPGYNTTFGFDGTTGAAQATNTAGDVLLATGSLANCGAPSASCQNLANVTNSVPTAAVTLTFNPVVPLEAGFFVAPPISFNLNLFGNFSNNVTEVVCYAATAAECGIANYGGALPSGAPAGTAQLFQLGNPTPGGGSITPLATAVPEPATLGMFGFGLLGLGFFRNRRKQQA